jgi:MoxR-like ATPase
MPPSEIDRVHAIGRTIQSNVARVIVGKEKVTELLVAALLAPGHVLIEDVPGIGKTMLAKSLARSLKASFQRIQFTPDLLPADITGSSVFNQKTTEFEFRPGPVMAQIVLADEINRAGPRTQSALLEAMEERQVTVDGVTHRLAEPFLVLATQNPIELEGTFPLPEAQIDRFLMRLAVGYPSRDEERAILHRFVESDPLADLAPVAEAADLAALGHTTRAVHMSASLENYLLGIAEATRKSEELALGVSPRGSLALYRTAQCLAALRGRAFVLPDDIQELLTPVLAHRLILSSQARLRERTIEAVLRSIVETIPVPVEESWSEKMH